MLARGKLMQLLRHLLYFFLLYIKKVFTFKPVVKHVHTQMIMKRGSQLRFGDSIWLDVHILSHITVLYPQNY